MKVIDASGIITETWYNPHDDVLTVKRTQDVEPILEDNKSAYNSAPKHGQRFQHELVEVAYIPNIVIEQWLKEGLNIYRGDKETRKRLMAKLNDPDFRALRSRPGKL